jgi:transposase
MAQIFVAVLRASSFTFARAGWTQALPDWIDAPRDLINGCLALA